LKKEANTNTRLIFKQNKDEKWRYELHEDGRRILRSSNFMSLASAETTYFKHHKVERLHYEIEQKDGSKFNSIYRYKGKL